MEYYTLNSSLQRDTVIEGFESMLWTERYNTLGDFVLDIAANPANRVKYAKGTMLGRAGSQRIMVVDTITDATDDNGTEMLEIKGSSFEKLLDDRVAMPALGDLTTTPSWVITDTPGNIMRYIFTQICVMCVLSSDDTIPFYTSGTLNAAGSIAEPSDTVTITLTPGSLYTALNTIATTYNLGFRLVKDGDTGNVYFEVHTGNDCTSDQTDRPAVIFSEDLGNLTDKTTLTSSANTKTVAYVFAQNGAQSVDAPNVDTSATGLGRRVLYVDASSVDTAAGPDLVTQLTQMGLQALAAQQDIYQFDGQVSELGPYIYGVDYNLGDIVEEQDESGFGNKMQVTEQIFVSDGEGERAYPTLAVYVVVVPGTWSAWTPPTEDWADVPTSVHWADL